MDEYSRSCQSWSEDKNEEDNFCQQDRRNNQSINWNHIVSLDIGFNCDAPGLLRILVEPTTLNLAAQVLSESVYHALELQGNF